MNYCGIDLASVSSYAYVTDEKGAKLAARELGEREGVSPLASSKRGEQTNRRGANASLLATQQKFLERRIATEFGPRVTITERLTQLKHSVTRFRITLDCWLAETNGDGCVNTPYPTAWVTPSEFGRYPFSTSGRPFAETLLSELREPSLFRAVRQNS